MPASKPRTATDRSRARFQRAARVLGGITLDAGQAAALARILAASGETAAQWVRRMIAEQVIALRDAP